MNIKKIIRESLGFDNFEWLDTDIDPQISGQELYKLIRDFLKKYRNEYWIEFRYATDDDGGEIIIEDDTGRYYIIGHQDFNIPYLVKEFERTINSLTDDPETREEYIRLAKALEPIIGTVRYSGWKKRQPLA